MKKYFVSIYIVSHNYGRFLEKAIISILDQTFEDWYLYLIDDNSSDETLHCMQKYANSYERIELIRYKSRMGLQKITNLIGYKSKSIYFMRLDADDWLLESALASLSAAAQKHQLPKLVYGSYFYVGVDGKHIAYEAVPNINTEDYSLSNPSHGACTLIKTSDFNKVGGLYEDVKAQDGHDLWFKLVKQSSDVISIKTPIFYYRQHDTSISKSSDRLRKARNSIYSKIASSKTFSIKKRNLAIVPIKNEIGSFKDIAAQIIDGVSVVERVFNRVTSTNNITEVIFSSPDEVALELVAKLQTSFKKTTLVTLHHRKTSIFKDIFELFRTIQKDLVREMEEEFLTVSVVNAHNVYGKSDTIDDCILKLKLTKADICFSAQIERAPILRHTSRGLEVVGLGRHNGLFSHEQELLRYSGGVITFNPTVASMSFPWQNKIVHVEVDPKEEFVLTLNSLKS